MTRSAKFAIELHPSAILTTILCLLHTAALGVVLLSPVDLLLRVGFAAAIALSAAHSIRNHARLNASRSVVRLVLYSDGRALLYERNDTAIEGQVCPDSFVSPPLTVLRVRPDGRRFARNVVLMPDSADSERLRALRVFLRFKVETEQS